MRALYPTHICYDSAPHIEEIPQGDSQASAVILVGERWRALWRTVQSELENGVLIDGKLWRNALEEGLGENFLWFCTCAYQPHNGCVGALAEKMIHIGPLKGPEKTVLDMGGRTREGYHCGIGGEEAVVYQQ